MSRASSAADLMVCAPLTVSRVTAVEGLETSAAACRLLNVGLCNVWSRSRGAAARSHYAPRLLHIVSYGWRRLQQASHGDRSERADELRHDEARHVRRRDAGERIRERPGDGDGGIGERGG
jgi:hypothetical protein